ncbi:MAG: hypothetical protein AAB664_00810 [Patescibacteria group bacterium]
MSLRGGALPAACLPVGRAGRSSTTKQSFLRKYKDCFVVELLAMTKR